ncbi:helix-turn-helix transcriptional regulator [Streptomyces sp. HNM0645]|uniref:helix-turn-helix domain-containing protein n=1 Tax=Streptomyces sp. HNM0645 TaxID=2782343 RepID=UPI0024B6A463|nr:helix-turn-helix transcriptional regulator [Streptomyces sp. HNM0645]MDI9886517.1 helix-turn-helix transcriptional regulator [Streptomyces sp. HNM0645]
MSQLHALGIDRTAEAVYRLMLAEPEHGVAELAESLSLSVDEIRAALDQLAELRLLRTSLQADGGLRPVSPTVGIQLLLAVREKELRHAQQEFADAQAAAMALLQQHAEAETGRHDVEVLTGIEEVQARLEQLTHNSTAPLMSFMPGGAQSQAALDASRPLDAALLARGIPVRTLYQASVRNDPATLDYARWLTSQGAQVRTAAVLPVRMVLFTGQAALLPIDPDHTRRGAVQLRGPGVLTALAALFDAVWEQADVFGTAADRELDDNGLTGQERQLLRLLAQGHTDAIVARRLGIGVRTARRMMADIMTRLGARSRFEAGAKAVRRGWLSH